MLTETGVVSKIEADGVWVRSQRQSACGACQARSGCGQRLLYTVTGNSIDVFAKFPQGESFTALSVGDQVEIEVSENAIVNGSLLLYVLPLAVFISALIVFEQMFSAPGWLSFVLGLASLFFTVRQTRSYLNTAEALNAYQPSLVRKLNSTTPE